MLSRHSYVPELHIHTAYSTDSLAITDELESCSDALPCNGTFSGMANGDVHLEPHVGEVEEHAQMSDSKKADLVVLRAKMNRLEDEFKKKLMVYERKRNEIDAMVQRTDELLKAHQAINAHIMGRINDLSSMSMEVDELEDLFKETPVDYSKIDNIVDSLSAIADKHDIHPTVSEAIDNLNIVRGFGYSVYTQLKEMPQQAQSQSKALAGDKGRLAQIFATIEFLQDSASERIKEKCIQEMEQREMRHEEATMGVKEACRKQLGEYCTSSMKYTGGERELYWETAEIPESKIQDLKDKLEAGSARGGRNRQRMDSSSTSRSVRIVSSAPSNPNPSNRQRVPAVSLTEELPNARLAMADTNMEETQPGQDTRWTRAASGSQPSFSSQSAQAAHNSTVASVESSVTSPQSPSTWCAPALHFVQREHGTRPSATGPKIEDTQPVQDTECTQARVMLADPSPPEPTQSARNTDINPRHRSGMDEPRTVLTDYDSDLDACLVDVVPMAEAIARGYDVSADESAFTPVSARSRKMAVRSFFRRICSKLRAH